MDKEEVIKKFLNNRPEIDGAFGYGSGVIKQSNYTDNDKPQIDMILLTDDIKAWHIANIARNPFDYSLQGRFRLSYLSRSQMKGHNNIVYCSQVKENGSLFKYGVIETDDFIKDLKTWDTFYVAGRFHKPMLKIQSTKEIDDAIESNRLAAFMIACLMNDEFTTDSEILYSLCNLSYMGDFRMGIAENPNKVWNILNGSYYDFYKIYKDYPFKEQMHYNDVFVDHASILENLDKLPRDLLNYLSQRDDKSLSFDKRLLLIRKGIVEYLIKKNRIESITQAIEGFNNNGLVKSIPYVANKLSKKLQKNKAD